MAQSRTTPGYQFISIIYAPEGTMGEKIIEQMVTGADKHGELVFTQWQYDSSGFDNRLRTCTGNLTFRGFKRRFRLAVGPIREFGSTGILILQDIPQGENFSLKHTGEYPSSQYILGVGAAMSDNMIRRAAVQIPRVWIGLGENWKNGRGKINRYPWGKLSGGSGSTLHETPITSGLVPKFAGF